MTVNLFVPHCCLLNLVLLLVFSRSYCYTVWLAIGIILLSICLWRCAFWLSGLVYRAKSCSVFLRCLLSPYIYRIPHYWNTSDMLMNISSWAVLFSHNTSLQTDKQYHANSQAYCMQQYDCLKTHYCVISFLSLFIVMQRPVNKNVSTGTAIRAKAAKRGTVPSIHKPVVNY